MTTCTVSTDAHVRVTAWQPPAGQVALRVCVHHSDPSATLRSSGSQLSGDKSLAAPAFEVVYRNEQSSWAGAGTCRIRATCRHCSGSIAAHLRLFPWLLATHEVLSTMIVAVLITETGPVERL